MYGEDVKDDGYVCIFFFNFYWKTLIENEVLPSLFSSMDCIDWWKNRVSRDGYDLCRFWT